MSQTYTIIYKQKEYTLEVERDNNELIVTHQGESYRVEVKEERTSSPAPAISTSAPAMAAPAPIPATAAPAAPQPLMHSPAAGGANAAVVAPMTGVIKALHVARGDTVASGALVITMEAMKMDIQINAHRDGAVAEIHIKVGDSVQQNATLLTLT